MGVSLGKYRARGFWRQYTVVMRAGSQLTWELTPSLHPHLLLGLLRMGDKASKPPGARTQVPKNWHSKSRQPMSMTLHWDPGRTQLHDCGNGTLTYTKVRRKTVPFSFPFAGLASLPVRITSKRRCVLTSCCVHAGAAWGSRHREPWCHNLATENKNVHIPARYHPATFLGIWVKKQINFLGQNNRALKLEQSHIIAVYTRNT